MIKLLGNLDMSSKKNKCAMVVQILPRLEAFYLEEWIEHHLSMGIDHVFIYNNGFVSVGPDQEDINWVREISRNERKQGLWSKKPNNDYFLDYSELAITEIMMGIVSKFPGKVTLTSWICGRDHEFEFPKSQVRAFEHAVDRYVEYEWWLHIDPDEYLRLGDEYDNNIHNLLNDHDEWNCLYIHQRVFSMRERDKNVREITTWGYDAPIPKSLIRRNIKSYNIHKSIHNEGKHRLLSMDVVLFNHYRGPPSTSGGVNHVKFGYGLVFDKTDDYMLRFIK